MAGPAVEQVWQDFKDRGVQVLALDFWNGVPSSVEDYIRSAGATYPVLMDAGVVTGSYGIAYDNYVVVDAEGIVRYTSVHETFTGLGRWNDAAVRSVVEQWLPTAVEQRTWSAMKALFQAADTAAPPVRVP